MTEVMDTHVWTDNLTLSIGHHVEIWCTHQKFWRRPTAHHQCENPQWFAFLQTRDDLLVSERLTTNTYRLCLASEWGEFGATWQRQSWLQIPSTELFSPVFKIFWHFHSEYSVWSADIFFLRTMNLKRRIFSCIFAWFSCSSQWTRACKNRQNLTDAGHLCRSWRSKSVAWNRNCVRPLFCFEGSELQKRLRSQKFQVFPIRWTCIQCMIDRDVKFRVSMRFLTKCHVRFAFLCVHRKTWRSWLLPLNLIWFVSHSQKSNVSCSKLWSVCWEQKYFFSKKSTTVTIRDEITSSSGSLVCCLPFCPSEIKMMMRALHLAFQVLFAEGNKRFLLPDRERKTNAWWI